jgi:phosphoglycerate dehydrogenase-like enzyme
MKRVLIWTAGGEQPLCEALRDVQAVEVRRAIGRADALEAMREADGLVTSTVLWGPDLARALRAAERLVWIQVLNAGFDNMERLGVPERVTVSTLGGIGAAVVAEHAIGLLLALLRGLPAALEAQRRHEWEASGVVGGTRTLHDLEVAVIGFGHIGRRVARLAQAFGARIVAFARTARRSAEGIEVRTLDRLRASLSSIGAVVICAPLNAGTDRLLDAAAFEAMRQGTFLVNVARGGIVDTAALVQALRSGIIAAAALDVTDPEPLSGEHPLWSLPNVLLTPHTAWAGGGASQAREARELVVENVRRFARDEAVLNVASIRHA